MIDDALVPDAGDISFQLQAAQADIKLGPNGAALGPAEFARIEQKTHDYRAQLEEMTRGSKPTMAFPMPSGELLRNPDVPPVTDRQIGEGGAVPNPYLQQHGDGMLYGYAAAPVDAHNNLKREDLPPQQTLPTAQLYENARQASLAKNSNQPRREGAHSTRRPWNADEEKALMMGLDMVKGPHWSQILGLFGPSGTMSDVLKDRTQVQLKDKARNLKLFFLKNNCEMPYYLKAVTGELKTRAPTQAARKEAEEAARQKAEGDRDHVQVTMTLAGGLQDPPPTTSTPPAAPAPAPSVPQHTAPVQRPPMPASAIAQSQSLGQHPGLSSLLPRTNGTSLTTLSTSTPPSSAPLAPAPASSSSLNGLHFPLTAAGGTVSERQGMPDTAAPGGTLAQGLTAGGTDSHA